MLFLVLASLRRPFLACFSLSKTLVDPLQHVVLMILRSLRRIASFDLDVATEHCWDGSFF